MTDNEREVNATLQKEPLVLVLKPSSKKRFFTEIDDFRKFIESEVEFWAALMRNPSRPRHTIGAVLTIAQTDLGNIERGLAIKPENALGLVRSACEHLQELPLFSQTTEGQFVGGLLKISTEQALGAIAFLFPSGLAFPVSLTSAESFRGFLEASVRFGPSSETRAKKVVAELDQQRKSLEGGFADLQAQFHELSVAMSQKAESHEGQFQARSVHMKATQDHWTKQVETFHQEAQTRLAELEQLYRERLRLKGPTEYWNDLAKRYRTSGIVWSIISGFLVLAGSVGGIAGLDFFQKTLQAGQTVTQGTMTTDWSHVVPVTIVFGVIISVWVFVIRTTIRLALSGFHLVRDAVEREQLSHYHLAMIAEDKNLESEAKTIILQSLFSRAETGLLKGESGPTMPGNLAEILRNLRG